MAARQDAKFYSWEFGFGCVRIPDDIIAEARRLGNGILSFDKRTKSYRHVKKWSEEYEQERWKAYYEKHKLNYILRCIK